MEIVKATVGDIEALREIWNDQHDYHYEIHPKYYDLTQKLTGDWRAFLELELINPAATILLAKSDGEIYGFLRMHLINRKNYDRREVCVGSIEDIYVFEARRRESIGQALMSHAEEQLREQGVQFIEVQCSLNNEDAIKFYRSVDYDDMRVLFYKALK